MRVGILGSGLMGGKLGVLFARAGHSSRRTRAPCGLPDIPSHLHSWWRSLPMRERAARNWHTASSGLGHERRHARTRCVGQLLRDRRLGCRRPDRLAVRGLDAHRRQAANTRRRGRRRVAVVGASPRSLANHHAGRSSLGPHRPEWGSVHGNRSSAHAASCTPPAFEQLVVSCPPHSRCRHLRRMRTRGRCSLSLALPPCCCFSLAFPMPGTPSPTMSLSAGTT